MGAAPLVGVDGMSPKPMPKPRRGTCDTARARASQVSAHVRRTCCLNWQPLDQGPPRATLTGRGGVLGFLGAPASGAGRL